MEFKGVNKLRKITWKREYSKAFSAGAKVASNMLGWWYSLQESQRKKWEEWHPYHHGAYGLISYILGLFFSQSESTKAWGEFLEGLGAALMIDDINDINKWFRGA